ncbi:MAG: hypothetical protein ABI693_07975 [Bryobacteraceae bacterium]
MDHWLAEAESILAIARASWDSSNSEIVIIRDWAGGLEIKDGAGWSLFGLQAASGAKAVYRVTRTSTCLKVEVVCGSQSRLFKEELAPRSPSHPAHPHTAASSSSLLIKAG